MLFAIQPKQAFVVQLKALPSPQDMQTPVAEAAALMGQRAQPMPQLRISRPTATIPHRHPHAPDGFARPPLAHLERSTQVSDSLSLGSGRQRFFVSRSFSAALSSIASANSFFSLAFSFSNPFRRLASETARPPYLDFQL